MITTIKGEIVEISKAVFGDSHINSWKRQKIILQCGMDKMAVTIWNDQVNIENLAIGQNIKLKVQVKSREYKGKWFTDINVSHLITS